MTMSLPEKLKDIFPDPNIEAALIAMDNFAAMQTKAKQLVQIYKPAHDSPMASAAILVILQVTHLQKVSPHNLKVTSISWPLLISHKKIQMKMRLNIVGDNADEDVDMIEGLVAVVMEITLINRYDQQDRGASHGQGQQDFQYNRGRGQDNSYRGRRRQWDGNDSNTRDRDNRDRNSDGQGNSNRGRRWDNSNRGQGHSDCGRGRRWNQHQQYHDPEYQQQAQFSNPNHYRPPPMGHQYRYPIPYEQYSYPQQQQYQSQMPPAPSQQATNICQLCNSQGHYDYQCQFAGNFMARTQKAFNKGRSYSHQDPNHGEWSQGDNDNNDHHGQPSSATEDHDAADPPLRTLNVFYQGTNVEMLEETYLKFKKNILPKMKKMQPKLSRASS